MDRTRLVEIVKQLAVSHRDLLEQWKEESRDLERPDFMWHILLVSMATLGSSRGWSGLIGNRDNYDKVTYEALSQLRRDERLARLQKTLRVAKVRMSDKKAGWLYTNFELVQSMGGPEAIKTALLGLPGKEKKIEFLQQFAGIGEKYGRNILMDVYHPEFRDCIAVDARIEGISKALGLHFKSYREHERFYLEVAHEAGLNGWELDRLLYNFRDQIVRELG